MQTPVRYKHAFIEILAAGQDLEAVESPPRRACEDLSGAWPRCARCGCLSRQQQVRHFAPVQHHALTGPVQGDSAAPTAGTHGTSSLTSSGWGVEATCCCAESLPSSPSRPACQASPCWGAQRPLPCPAGMWHSLPFRLASCGGDRNIFQWDVSTGKIIRKFRGHDGDVNAVSAQLQASLWPADI